MKFVRCSSCCGASIGSRSVSDVAGLGLVVGMRLVCPIVSGPRLLGRAL